MPGHSRTSALLRLVALLLLTVTAQPAGAQRLQFAERMLELIGEGDVEAYAAFRQEAFADTDTPESEWRDVFVQLHDAFGHLETVNTSATPRQARIVTRPERIPEAVVIFEFRFEPRPPHRILEVGVAVEEADLASRAASLGIVAPAIRADMAPAEITAVLSPWLDELAGRDVLSGTVVITRDGAPLFSAAHGEASKSYGVPNTVETAYRVGSITKVFVRTAAARLIHDKRLDPDSTIADHLPLFPNPAAGRITVRQLLEQRSGLAPLRFEEFQQNSSRAFRRPADYFPLFAADALQFEPGTDTDYSNAGYIVLGAILEQVAGGPYEQVLRALVFEPAGMARSGFWALDRPHPGLATGYWKCDRPAGGWCNNIGVLEIEGTPSGGSYSTAADLLAFQRALSAAELLPADWTHWVYTGDWPGESVEPDPTRWQPFWAGGDEGVSALLTGRGDFNVVVLSNYDEPAGELIGMAILEALAGAR